VTPKPGMTRTETYEQDAKAKFIDEPATMKLLIVVDKLLTGFDAPACTYLYIDKSMQDHGLFQAICRTNRLDGDDKVFGYIVDYKDLFRKVENAIAVYTSDLDDSAGGSDPDVMLEDRLTKGRKMVEEALEALALHCEPVEPPKGDLQYMHYFCGNTEISSELEEREPRRAALYKAVVAVVRAYANIADELEAAGYGETDIARIKARLDHALKLRDLIRQASGETLDLKAYEADMRHLIDTYIEADEPRKNSPFDNVGLLELIVKSGIADAINSRLDGLRGNKDAIAETIENNVRRKIIKEHLIDPAYYALMSQLLDEIITERKANAIEYEAYLKKIAELAAKVQAGKADNTPVTLDTPGRRALYNNLTLDQADSGQSESHDPRAIYGTLENQRAISLALKIDEAVRAVRPDGWRGVQTRENVIKSALYEILQNQGEVERMFLIIKAQTEY